MTDRAPDFHGYYESINGEMAAVKNRIRSLVTHWPTDGAWKEVVLREVLRRHLPANIPVRHGFLVGRERSSRQIDILVLKPDRPTLFRDGDLVIATPDVPKAIVEIKTQIEGEATWEEALRKLAHHGELCSEHGNQPWLGLFEYEPGMRQGDNILRAICRVHQETGIAINCVSCGPSLFIRYWPPSEHERGEPETDVERTVWRSYKLDRLAPAYFVANLIDSVCDLHGEGASYAWWAYQSGKLGFMRSEIRAEDCALRRET